MAYALQDDLDGVDIAAGTISAGAPIFGARRGNFEFGGPGFGKFNARLEREVGNTKDAQRRAADVIVGAIDRYGPLAAFLISNLEGTVIIAEPDHSAVISASVVG